MSKDTSSCHLPDKKILYVDDESMACKYFSRSFGKEFPILTAMEVPEALSILRCQAEEIGVVVADQRMPGCSGAEFLSAVRQRHPGVVRILTTAFSDIDGAIASVNEGGIYHYITKPWDLQYFRIVLRRAMENHLLAHERQVLLDQKLHALQRFIVSDRIRSLAILANGLASRLRNPLLALKTFLECSPVPEPSAAQTNQADWQQLLVLARSVSAQTLGMVQQLVQQTKHSTTAFAEVDLGDLIATTLSNRRDDTAVLDPPKEPARIRADASMLQRLLSILLDRVHDADPEGLPELRLRREVQYEAQGYALDLRLPGRIWEQDTLRRCYGPLSGGPDNSFESDLLFAYFITYHHSGTMALHLDQEGGPGFHVFLPDDPEQAVLPDLDPGWDDRLFTYFPALLLGE